MNNKEIELIDGFFNKGWCCDLDEVYNTIMKLQKEYEKEKEINHQLEIQLEDIQENFKKFNWQESDAKEMHYQLTDLYQSIYRKSIK